MQSAWRASDRTARRPPPSPRANSPSAQRSMTARLARRTLAAQPPGRLFLTARRLCRRPGARWQPKPTGEKQARSAPRCGRCGVLRRLANPGSQDRPHQNHRAVSKGARRIAGGKRRSASARSPQQCDRDGYKSSVSSTSSPPPGSSRSLPNPGVPPSRHRHGRGKAGSTPRLR